MFSITNKKVAGLTPRWAEFRGFSLLFDNPGDGLVPHGTHRDLACAVDTDPALGFYRSLRDEVTALNPDLLTSTFLFCPLPPHSYHVTAWDGGNDDNRAKVTGEQRPKLEAYLAGLPEGLAAVNDVVQLAQDSPLVRRQDWNLEFQFDHLSIWGGMVARLAPAEASRERFQQFVEERRRLNAACWERFGIRASENYSPHVSLSYFASREGSLLASATCRHGTRRFKSGCRGRPSCLLLPASTALRTWQASSQPQFEVSGTYRSAGASRKAAQAGS